MSSLRIERSEWFPADLEHYAAWCDRDASWEVAERFLKALEMTTAFKAEIAAGKANIAAGRVIHRIH